MARYDLHSERKNIAILESWHSVNTLYCKNGTYLILKTSANLRFEAKRAMSNEVMTKLLPNLLI